MIKCGECGMDLPLVLADPSSDNAKSWVCKFCGSHYSAELDPDAAEDLHRNVSAISGA